MNDNRLEILLDKQAITEVLHRSCRGMDRLDMDLIESVYWPDSEDLHGPFNGNITNFSVSLKDVGGEGSPIKMTNIQCVMY